MDMDSVLRGFVDSGRAAGVSALICDRGRESYFGCYGAADMASGRAFERDTLCCVYSMTKVVTSAALLTLVDAGRVGLDQPISDICPEYAHMRRVRRVPRSDAVEIVAAQTPLTFRHLLTMTSGMLYSGDDATPEERAVHAHMEELTARMRRGEEPGGTPYTAARLAREMAELPLAFEPGARWHYGVSLDVVGGLIEIVTGMSLEQYMKAAIFDKLGMRDTYFSVPESERGRMASIYTLSGGALAPWRRQGGMPFVNARALCSGGAGLIMTIDDYARFANMLALGGELDGVRVLSGESVRLMRSDMLADAIKPSFNWIEERGYTYGLAVRVMREPSRSSYREQPGAFGWNGMAGTSVRIYPEEGRTALFFIQLVPAMHANYLPAFVQAANGVARP